MIDGLFVYKRVSTSIKQIVKNNSKNTNSLSNTGFNKNQLPKFQ